MKTYRNEHHSGQHGLRVSSTTSLASCFTQSEHELGQGPLLANPIRVMRMDNKITDLRKK